MLSGLVQHGFAEEAHSVDVEMAGALFDYQRPVILNGIDDVATRHDLADRSLNLVLPPIPDAERKTEATFWRDWELVRPRVFGALLDAVSTALRRVDSVHLPRKPRMADFAVWATAAEPAFGWPEGAALKAYAENRAEAVELGIESDAVAFTVCELLKHKPDGFEGTMTELLDELEDHASDKMRNAKTWPGSARSLSNRLRRSSTALRQVGINVDLDRRASDRNRTRLVRIDNACISSSASSTSSEGAPKGVNNGVSASDATSDATDANNGTSSTSSETSSDGKSPSLCGLRGVSDATDATDAKIQGLSKSEVAAAQEVFEL
jgi:hypothetical protein